MNLVKFDTGDILCPPFHISAAVSPVQEPAFKSKVCDRVYLRHLTGSTLLFLVASKQLTMQVDCSFFTQDKLDELYHPILFPSGIWADFNPVNRYYRGLQLLVYQRFIHADDLPDPPVAADYPDLVSPRSPQWEPFSLFDI